MPPARIPPAKAVKTERTHEENQERAYIAASRRSDRSLEARVESARRASEIHKRRTGRSLRVTEQDVQNEEMYEEEDDDLPLQYRRLTAHLQTGSADFNRRLSAYLTNHVAMRSALEQSIHNSYAQQFPNAPHYATQSMFPSPMLAHQAQQQQMMQPPQSPSIYRQSPYPAQSPRMQQQGFTLPHQRSNSVSQPSSASPPGEHSEQRSMSASTPSGTYSPTTPSSSTTTNKPSFPPGSFSNTQIHSQTQTQFSLPTYDMGAFASSQFPSFTTQLPAETQGFLGGSLDPNDPLTSMMMAGSSLPGTTYNFATSTQHERGQQATFTKQHQIYPTVDGLNATLAPSVLEKGKDSVGEKDDVIEGGSFFDSAIEGRSGLNTPGLEGDNWDSWINDSQWDIPQASQ